MASATLASAAKKNSVPIVSIDLQRVTFALIAIATVAIEIASLAPNELVVSGVLSASGAVLVAGILFRYAPGPKAGQFKLPWWLTLAIVALMVFPFAFESLRPSLGLEERPLEIQMVAAFRNLGLILGVLSAWMVCMRLCVAISLFLILFAITITELWYVLIPTGVFAGVGVWWLAVAYWSTLNKSSEELQLSKRPPWVIVALGAGIVSTVVAVYSVGPNKVLGKLGELMPTSGGTDQFDTRARGGVNDGDDTTAGKDPKSGGFTDSQIFLESPLPSLYDLASDMYGKPKKKNDEMEQAKALSGVEFREMHKRPSDVMRPSRNFSTSREAPKKSRDPKARAARAIYEVDGVCPVHIRVVAYDLYDGIEWHEARVIQAAMNLDKDLNSDWLLTPETERKYFNGQLTHQIKVAKQQQNEASKLVPTTEYFSKIKVGRIDDPSFFCWAQERVLRFANRTTPDLITIDLVSNVPDERLLREQLNAPFVGGAGNIFLETPNNDAQQRVKALAAAWTKDVPPGWAQVEAVMQRLKRNYTIDPDYVAPSGTIDLSVHFLFESKRGPDYAFATAAAMLLRHLGHPSRVCMGYYASPAHYDRETKHTPVVAEDLHFWPEVLVPGPTWIVLEPTPGYETMQPPTPWYQGLVDGFHATVAWVERNAILTIFSLIAIVMLIVFRASWLDRVFCWLWYLRPGRNTRAMTTKVAALMDRRLHQLKRERPGHVALSRWLEQLFPGESDLATLARRIDWAQFSPPESTLPDIASLDELKQQYWHLLRHWSRRRMKQHWLARTEIQSTWETRLV